MNRLKQLPWMFLLLLLILMSMGCAVESYLPGAEPTFPPVPPTPSTNNQPTGSSPMSGDWNASTDFGRLAFTIDPTGTSVTTAVVKLANYTCGGTTLTTETQGLNTWPVVDHQFSVTINLSVRHIEDLSILGIYDPINKKFSGNWEEDMRGTHCSGTWETIARK